MNFPLLVSLLAALEEEHYKFWYAFWWATGIAVFSLIVSIISLVIAARAAP